MRLRCGEVHLVVSACGTAVRGLERILAATAGREYADVNIAQRSTAGCPAARDTSVWDL